MTTIETGRSQTPVRPEQHTPGVSLTEEDMLLTLAWWGSAVVGRRFSARYAMNRGKIALGRRQYPRAARYLQRAAAYEPLREEAVCLLAEAAVYDHRPGDALFALNTFVMEREEMGQRDRSARVRLLRGVAACMLGRGAAARRELAEVSRHEADVDERLAAAQACIMADDLDSAGKLLDTIPDPLVADGLAARVRLCRAALLFRRGEWRLAELALPPEAECTPKDAAAARRARDLIRAKLEVARTTS